MKSYLIKAYLYILHTLYMITIITYNLYNIDHSPGRSHVTVEGRRRDVDGATVTWGGYSFNSALYILHV